LEATLNFKNPLKLLILDNYDSFTYNLVQLVEEIGVQHLEIFKNDELALNQVIHFDKILLTPGPDIPRTAGVMCELIQQYASSKSILGVCLGHQAIAEVLGGKLINMPSVKHGIREKAHILDAKDYLFAGLPSEMEVGLYHSWSVSPDLPECLQITSQSHEGNVLSISHIEWDVKGIQFHPESIMTPFGKKIIENWLLQ
jgi:anthranilate synthase component II